jgi:Met-zincin/Domain of unknown function (DUF5117)
VAFFALGLACVLLIANLPQGFASSFASFNIPVLTARLYPKNKPVQAPRKVTLPSRGEGSRNVMPPLPAQTAPVKQTAAQAQQLQEFEQLVKGMQRLEGLFTLYRGRQNNKLFAEVGVDQLNTYFLCITTLESGLGESGLISGLPLLDSPFSSASPFYLRFINNTLQWVVPNFYFRAQATDPLQRALRRSFSESVLAVLPIRGYHPGRKAYLVELAPTLLGDFANLRSVILEQIGAGYELDEKKTYLGKTQSFPLNSELETVYSFTGGLNGQEETPIYIEGVPDSRSFNLRVRYSLSKLPMNNGYRPRKADERVGYFITAFQNLSDESPSGPFVRYIDRWHLEKQDPTAPLSLPKKPILFWIENTVPVEYRDAVRDGVLMWNRAFEKIGFKDAIQVQQMPNNASWDPADVRYNTIRWVATHGNGFLGVGPKRSNPLTGEILDADILIDAGVVRTINQQYRSLVDRNPRQKRSASSRRSRQRTLCFPHEVGLSSPPTNSQSVLEASQRPRQAIAVSPTHQLAGDYDLCFGESARQKFAMGGLALTLLRGASPTSAEAKRYTQEFLRELVAHEVGHTLGLRHNFRGSAMLSPAELHNTAVTRRKGLVASVMDYNGVNVAPDGTAQGDYFTAVVGPYDEWAIAYGYTPSPGKSLQDEAQLLDTIAKRAIEPDLAYGTEEDLFSELDPQVNWFDLSNDLLVYAPQQFEIARKLWQQLEQRYPLKGSSFSDVRTMFERIYIHYFYHASFLTQYVGGQSFNRYKSGDAAGRLPFETIPVEKQRQALNVLSDYVFAPQAFQFSANFVNKLAPSLWYHWGQAPNGSTFDYPIYDRILGLQTNILGDLLSYTRLERLRDADLKASAGASLTLPELFETLQGSIWREVLQPGHQSLSSLRRGLQRDYVNRLTQMVLRTDYAPDDARALARSYLKQLHGTIADRLKDSRTLEATSRAHLEETSDRIRKTLDAQMLTR